MYWLEEQIAVWFSLIANLFWIDLLNRVGIAFLILACSRRLFKMSDNVKNEPLMKFTRKASIVLYTFYVARVVAALFDALMGYRIGICSSIVSYIYFGRFYFYIREQDLRLKDPSFGMEGLARLRHHIEAASEILQSESREEITGG